MLDLTASVLRMNSLQCGLYAEPFAGGCGLALSLLYNGHVAEICINDLDCGIWSFWASVLDHTDAFVEMVESTPITIEEWHRQRAALSAPDAAMLELGFATFFLNRTNRSGVIKGGGVIGGLDQTGNYKLDCRFNTEDLVRRLRRLSRYRDRIHLTNLDALDFLDHCSSFPQRSLLFIDPPYFKKGPGLYASYYKPDDHTLLAERVKRLKTPWLVTYDDVPQIRDLYKDTPQFGFDIRYSLNEKRTGNELLIAPPRLEVPAALWARRIHPDVLAVA
jgi:DNA adenine methylase